MKDNKIFEETENKTLEQTETVAEKKEKRTTTVIKVSFWQIILLVALVVFLMFRFGIFHEKQEIRKPVETREVLNMEVTSIKEILKFSFMSVSYSDYSDEEYDKTNTKQNKRQKIGSFFHPGDEKDIIVFIDRGICKLGIDCDKIKEDFFIRNDEEKIINISLPDVEMIDGGTNYENSEVHVIVNSMLIPSDVDEKMIHHEIKQKCINEILNKYSKNCEETIREQLTAFIKLFYMDYTININFGG